MWDSCHDFECTCSAFLLILFIVAVPCVNHTSAHSCEHGISLLIVIPYFLRWIKKLVLYHFSCSATDPEGKRGSKSSLPSTSHLTSASEAHRCFSVQYFLKSPLTVLFRKRSCSCNGVVQVLRGAPNPLCTLLWADKDIAPKIANSFWPTKPRDNVVILLKLCNQLITWFHMPDTSCLSNVAERQPYGH